MADFVVRDALECDIESTLGLIKESAIFEKELESRVRMTENTLREDGFGVDKWFKCFVAETGTEKQVVGFALFFRTYSTWNGRSMKIADLYVKPEHRSKGIALKLMQEVTKEAIKQECVRIHWNILDWNTTSKDFCKHIGADIDEEWEVCTLHEREMKEFLKK